MQNKITRIKKWSNDQLKTLENMKNEHVALHNEFQRELQSVARYFGLSSIAELDEIMTEITTETKLYNENTTRLQNLIDKGGYEVQLDISKLAELYERTTKLKEQHDRRVINLSNEGYNEQ